MEWDWNQIAALSSLLGVIGGLISVVFLIYEVRHNAHAIEGATVQSLMTLESDVFGLIADNAELYLKGSDNLTDLAPAERLRFDRIVASQMSLFYSAYVQLQQGLIDEEVWDAYYNALKATMAGPGFALCWQGMETRYPLSFRQRIALPSTVQAALT
ncbi:MAG: hypothetical protein WBA91_00175 [Paracoccaceae bacterium]